MFLHLFHFVFFMIPTYPDCNSWYINKAGGDAYNATWQMHEGLVYEFSNILDNKTAVSKQSKILYIKANSVHKSNLLQHSCLAVVEIALKMFSLNEVDHFAK